MIIFLLDIPAEYVQEKIDRRNAEKVYSDNCEEVSRYIDKMRRKSRSRSSDEPNYDDAVADDLTLGLYSYTDPRSYDDEDEYVRNMLTASCFSLMTTNPREVIGKCILDGKSRDEIIDEFVEADRDDRWLGKRDKDNIPTTSDNPFSVITDVVMILFILMFPGFAVTMMIAAHCKRKRFVNIEDGKVYLGGTAPLELSEVTGAETGALHKVMITTEDLRYKRRFIKNCCEIAEFINECCNSSVQ